MDTNEHEGPSIRPQWASFFQMAWHRSALVLATVALLLTAFCIGLQQLPASGTAAGMAERWLVPPRLQADWEWVTFATQGKGLSNGELADHVILAGLQRRWFFATAEDTHYREHVLNPVLSEDANDTAWRRPLWEALWQLVRKEASRDAAAQKVRRLLYERVTITAEAQGGIVMAWKARRGDRREFELLSVAALRSVGIPARVSNEDIAEWLDGAQWQRFEEIDEIHSVLTTP